MNAIFESALSLQAFCDGRSWKACFIGGLAVQRWGEPRMTRDADLTLITGFGNEENFIDPLLAEYSGRREDARDFALKYRVLLLRDDNGTPLDIALGALPFEENTVARSSRWDIGSGELRTCSAEDLLVHKAFAGRDQDWLDIRGILSRQGSKILLDQVEENLAPLLELKSAPENLARLRKLIADSKS